jgi:prepilin-type N-terminal cleavage/methylation domain-containing protein
MNDKNRGMKKIKARQKKGGNNGSRGFTLIELLVVIAIIAILAVVVVLTLNPAQLLAQSRDSSRVSDFATLKSAISLYIIDSPVPNLASSSLGGYGACYLSTPSGVGTTTANCGVFTNSYSDASTSKTLYRMNNSSGWLPINFSQLSYGTPLGTLPVDPTNNANYYYSYAATSSGGSYFELDAFMESAKYNATTTGVVATDGGDNAKVYEAGNKPGLSL